MTIKLAIVHYHLRPGGVSRVVQHAVRALADHDVQVAVIVGDPGETDFGADATVRIVAGLAYDARDHVVDPKKLYDDLREAAHEALGGDPDVWHVHNHSLGKNVSLPTVLRMLAEKEQRLLLQCHDLAEDGRPENYARLVNHIGAGDIDALAQQLYPVAPHVHYATLNHRDRGWLSGAGVPVANLHVLPNAVELPGTDEVERQQPKSGFVLYPTRAIRRKNLGEFLLWAAACPDDCSFATTLAPSTQSDVLLYENWLQLAEQLNLPYEPEVGTKADVGFVQLLKSASALATTSVAEGFGLAFLEPWLTNRPVIGRDLPEITRDFKDEGLNLDHLYKRLDVPLDWIGRDKLRQTIDVNLRRIRQQYRMACTEDDVDQALDAAVQDGLVDFACLDEPMQQAVVRRLAGGDNGADEVRGLEQTLKQIPGEEAIAHNRGVVKQRYTLKKYGERLLSLYDTVTAAEAGRVDRADGEAILKSALDPSRFRLMRA
jgi:glycosyltransferase involved in cell wall biosynthesis